jgi:hypothetical protein
VTRLIRVDDYPHVIVFSPSKMARCWVAERVLIDFHFVPRPPPSLSGGSARCPVELCGLPRAATKYIAAH